MPIKSLKFFFDLKIIAPGQMRTKDRPYHGSRYDDHDRRRSHRSHSRSPKRYI